MQPFWQSRHALQAQVDALAAEGLYPAGAFELEFFLLANDRGPDGKVQPARDVLDGRGSHKTEVYSVDHLHGMLPLFSDIYAGAAKAGIMAETMISEYAPGQYELTLHYRADVMQAADDLMRLKRIVRAQADRDQTVLVAEAERDAQKLRGEGDAEAARIYGAAANRDPAFYAFQRSLEAYRASFADGQGVIVLDKDDPFLQYMKSDR